jgi:hypothetical protein
MVFRSLSEVLMVFRRVAFSNLGWLMEGKICLNIIFYKKMTMHHHRLISNYAENN